MSRVRVEVKVGLFVFVGLMVLGTMILLFGFRSARLLHNTYRLTAVFHFTNGVVVGAPVRLSGVEVGKVQSIEFAQDQSNDVYIHMDIRKGIIIRKDGRLIINSLGIMGEKYLEFLSKSATAEPYVAWDKVRGEEPLALNDVVSEALKLVGEFRTAVQDIFDDRTKENVRETVQNLRDLTDHETKEALTQSLKNIARLTGPQTRKKLRVALGEFGETASSMKTVINENRENIQAILEKWKRISESLDGVMSDLKMAKGTLGLLVSSPTVHNSLHETLENINAWITSVRRHGLLYKEKDLDSKSGSAGAAQSEENKGYFYKRK
ncbi:MAG: MCE family protein [Chlamydiae bacterium]|nr:MCE family protein [Chlamydiota bacterium]MBI3276805.1 MCE family protein [Chlamydiota bacterium]